MTSTISLIPTEPASASLIKTDISGRMRRTREQRERILDEFERSGLSGPKFAALCGVKYQTFATWWQRRRRRQGTHSKRQPRPKAANQVRWLEASVQAVGSSAQGLLLQLPGGGKAQLSHPEHIVLAAALLRALEKPC